VHELSIALSLVDCACAELPRLGKRARIAAVHVRLGPLAGIVKEALRFSFEVAAAGSAIEGARIEIEDVDLRVSCPACGRERRLENPQALRCPACGTLTPEVITGRELELAALEVIDDADDAAYRRGSPEHPQEE